jgi:hypothetical protein
MTVALGPAGNNFILGGKLANLSAEDAYTVCTLCHNSDSASVDLIPSVALDYSRLWEGRCL